MLDKIQRGTTRLITGLRHSKYEKRLKERGLTSLDKQRLRGDQIEVFTIKNGYGNFIQIFNKIKRT